MKTLGKMLREARESQKMTQEMLANHIKMSRSAISNWERDESQPDFYMLSRISKLLHYDFFADEDNIAANQEQKAKRNPEVRKGIQEQEYRKQMAEAKARQKAAQKRIEKAKNK